MDGVLLVPPERGTILGKTVCKPRYVVIGPLLHRSESQSSVTLSQVLSTARMRDAGGKSSKPLQKASVDTIFFSVYKSKEDVDPIIQHAITSITDCQVLQIAHRKHTQPLPTLTLQITPDPATEKLRKRRSSRAGGLMASRDAGPITLWFLASEDSRYTLGDWARYIQVLIQRQQSLPTSPISTASSGFVASHPATQDSEEQRPITKGRLMSKFQSKSSSKSVPPLRDQSAAPSGTPSLRSHKSNISSQVSGTVPAALSFVQQHYPSGPQSDLPSPTYMLEEHRDQFIEGWTTAQGRSSALSSPIRARVSIGSSNDNTQPSLDSSPPMVPREPLRETILDRAFQLRYIPGSDREITAGQENLTSLARFEALMREVDTRRQNTRHEQPLQSPLRSTWEEESEDDDYNRGSDDDEEDQDSDNYALEKDTDHDEMGPSTMKALRFITNRHNSTGSQYGLSVQRSQSVNSRSRPATKRTNSQPFIPAPQLNMLSSPPTHSEMMRRSHEKRRSTCDSKNLSFNEFAQRLSGTSSLLLVQSNVSGGSNRGSSDYEAQHTPRGSISAAVPGQTPNDRDDHCLWRGGIGVFGNEGGFL